MKLHPHSPRAVAVLVVAGALAGPAAASACLPSEMAWKASVAAKTAQASDAQEAAQARQVSAQRRLSR